MTSNQIYKFVKALLLAEIIKTVDVPPNIYGKE